MYNYKAELIYIFPPPKITYFSCPFLMSSHEHFTALIFILIFLLSQRGMLDTFVEQYKAETKAISPSVLAAGKIDVD